MTKEMRAKLLAAVEAMLTIPHDAFTVEESEGDFEDIHLFMDAVSTVLNAATQSSAINQKIHESIMGRITGLMSGSTGGLNEGELRTEITKIMKMDAGHIFVEKDCRGCDSYPACKDAQSKKERQITH